jgi:hypothetical protein
MSFFNTDDIDGILIKKEWQNMPEFVQEDLLPYRSVTINFMNDADVDEFSKLIDQPITKKTKFRWFPYMPSKDLINYRYIDRGEPLKPKYPIYIISKGRWHRRLTSKALESMNVEYKIVIEPQEYDQYAEVIDPDKILVLPFSNLGQGSIPARNWVWEHSMSIGAERHWIMDDNITVFYRLNRNLKVRLTSGTIFRCSEDFVDRYENVGISGFNYEMFIFRKGTYPPFYLNTRIYSCILIKNDIPYRWRGRYNEDTDLSLRALKDGWCTVLFNAFLADKMGTMRMSGGNTDELYIDDGRLDMAKSLQKQHPDVVKVTRKWNRWQHDVNYKPFRHNRLIRKSGVEIPNGINEYGLVLEKL